MDDPGPSPGVYLCTGSIPHVETTCMAHCRVCLAFENPYQAPPRAHDDRSRTFVAAHVSRDSGRRRNTEAALGAYPIKNNTCILTTGDHGQQQG